MCDRGNNMLNIIILICNIYSRPPLKSTGKLELAPDLVNSVDFKVHIMHQGSVSTLAKKTMFDTISILC